MSKRRLSILPGPDLPHENRASGADLGDWTYKNVLFNIDIGILIIDLDQQKVAFRNPASTDILRDRDLPLSCLEILQLLGNESAEGFAEQTTEPRTIHLGQRILGFTSYPITPGMVCLFLRDITERIRFESIAQAINTMDNIGFIFSGIRHEIGNPLNSIKMTISVLRNNLEKFPQETIEAYIDRAKAEIVRIEYLLKGLKNFSMFETVECLQVDLGEFLRKFIDLVSRDLEQKGIFLCLEPVTGPVPVLIDPRALHQALLNLVTNAADSLESQPAPQVWFRVRFSDKLVWLSVEDNGCGMEEDQIKLLFHPFCTSKPQGNGLGLVITRKLLAMMQASIDITSQPGIGTKVAIALPMGEVGQPDPILEPAES